MSFSPDDEFTGALDSVNKADPKGRKFLTREVFDRLHQAPFQEKEIITEPASPRERPITKTARVRDFNDPSGRYSYHLVTIDKKVWVTGSDGNQPRGTYRFPTIASMELSGSGRIMGKVYDTVSLKQVLDLISGPPDSPQVRLSK